MIKIIDTSFYSSDRNSMPVLVKEHQPALGYIDHIKDLADIRVIKHLNQKIIEIINGIPYAGFKSRNKFWYIPFTTLRYIKEQNADIVLVQGLGFPLQVIALRMILHRRVKIIVQHHAEKPYTGIKRLCQQIADKYIDAYLFTALENNRAWKDNKIIRNEAKCFELLEASTSFVQQDRSSSRKKLGIPDGLVLLWVGRLIPGKDPFTVLEGFKKYLLQAPGACLYMIYQDEDLLSEIKNIIAANKNLQGSVILQGKVEHDELPYWFSAADLFISGSHSEGSGYALLEAMACGCIPVVTAIPSFKKITGEGQYGYLYEPGNAADLYDTLLKTRSVNRDTISEKIKDHFRKELSFAAIADNLYMICKKLLFK